MPGGDRTGPSGMGPMTGRGAGYCTGNPVPGYANAVGFVGRGRGGGGRGRGFRHWFYATGLTGWQRAAQAAVQPIVSPVPWNPATGVSPPPQDDPAGEVDNMKTLLAEAQNTISALRQRLDDLEAQAK